MIGSRKNFGLYKNLQKVNKLSERVNFVFRDKKCLFVND